MGKDFRGDRRSRVMRVVHAVYDAISLVLLCIAAVMAIGVVLLMLRGPQIRARIDRYEAMEIQDENDAFCRKVGLTPDTHTFTTCELDLDELRAKDEERMTGPLL